MALQNFADSAHDALVVLLAEDNLINQVYLAEILKLEGHEVRLANNGLQALEILKRERVDVVLMDIRMPEMDGLTAIRHIREHDSGIDPGLPIIAMSAESELDLQSLSREGQMNECLAKPISQETIGQAISKVTKGRVSRSAELTPQVEEPTDDTVLALAWLLRKARDNDALLRKLFAVFIGEHELRMNELKKTLESGDLSRLSFLAHALKGTAATMGAGRLRLTCSELDKSARSNDLKKAALHMTSVESALSEVAEAMRDYLKA